MHLVLILLLSILNNELFSRMWVCFDGCYALWSHTQNMGITAYLFIQVQVVRSVENQFKCMFYTSSSTATTAYL